MTDAARTHLEVIAPRVTVASYSDGDVVVEVDEMGGVVFEAAQLRTLRQALRHLPEKEFSTSLGENKLDEEGYVEYDGSTVSLYDTYPSSSIPLTAEEAAKLENWLFELGY